MNGAIDPIERVKQLEENYEILEEEYIQKCNEARELQAKMKEHEEKLNAKSRHYEMMFNDCERNRQILAAQMDIVYLIFGKRN